MSHKTLILILVPYWFACAQPGPGREAVRPGIDVLLTDSVRLITGRRVGLLTNQTGVDRSGMGDLERLLDAGVQVTAIFSPEHGYRGVLDQEDIGHGTDSATGIPIYSLYGAERAPTPAMFENVDVLLIDLQDIGARPYTYISTALLAMRVAARSEVHVVLLDRPNPIAGVAVQGPVLDTAFATFVGMLPVALRHGMTIGELALMGNAQLRMGAALTVVPVDGWRRVLWFDQTGLPWIRPSPNMPSLESATHYPGLVLLEGTNLSVGRGTPIAFQLLAAPWLNTRGVIDRVAPQVGVAFRDSVVVPESPTDGKYAGASLPAIVLEVTDRAAYDPVVTTIALLAAVRRVHADSFRFTPATFDRLAGNDGVRLMLERGEPWETIVASWTAGLTKFREMRRQYLLY